MAGFSKIYCIDGMLSMLGVRGIVGLDFLQAHPVTLSSRDHRMVLS